MSVKSTRRFTAVMYHFVRDLAHSPYPEIKGLTVDEFRGQVAFARRHFTPIGIEDVLSSIDDPERPLPADALVLTFDDGYRDHNSNVLPVLLENGMRGCFFPPAKAVLEHKVLAVNKIHFVLASTPDKAGLLAALYDRVDAAREEFELPSRREWERALAHPGRYDPAEVILIKRLLQRDLPETLRDRIIDDLFASYVTHDEADFANELYMDVDDVRGMLDAGMWIGSHSYDHCWLDSLDEESRREEIERSLAFLELVGADVGHWVMGYPYGAHDPALLELLREKQCKAGFTVEVRVADLDMDDPLIFPRIDTNDLPKRADAAPNEWTPTDQGGGL